MQSSRNQVARVVTGRLGDGGTPPLYPDLAGLVTGRSASLPAESSFRLDTFMDTHFPGEVETIDAANQAMVVDQEGSPHLQAVPSPPRPEDV